jgi:hypothetical protein
MGVLFFNLEELEKEIQVILVALAVPRRAL